MSININLTAQVKFSAVGDILLDRGVRKSIEQNNIYFPFEKVALYFKSNDINFFNLETPLAYKSDGVRINKRFSFRSEPEVIKGLKFSNLNVASVANNHTIDFGKSGFIKTIEYLKKDSIIPVGGGNNQDEAFTPAILNVKDQRTAIFGYLEFLLEGTIFNQSQPYPAYGDIDRLCNEIKSIRPKVDNIIISFHWGQEGAITPTMKQTEYAHKVIDAGADLVIGHHPHVLQSIETYKSKLILYSLGNFIFDNKEKMQNETAIFQCELKYGKIIEPHLIPIKIINCQPQTADSISQIGIYNHLNEVSKDFNTNLSFLNGIIKINKEDRIVKELKNSDLRIQITEKQITILDQYQRNFQCSLPDSNFQFIDADTWKVDSTLYIYAIVKNKKENNSQLAIFPFSTSKNIFLKPSLDAHKHYNAWKIQVSDIDGDTNPELIVGVKKSTRYYSEIENRIFVFNAENDYIYPKWLGSRLGGHILDFMVTSDKKLLLFQKSRNNSLYTLSSFKWNGFGFDIENVIKESENIQLLYY